MKKYKILFTLILISVSVILIGMSTINAATLKEDVSGEFGNYVVGSGLAAGTDLGGGLSYQIGYLITSLLGFLGVVLLAIIVYAGYLWMTAAGNDEQVTKAKKWLRNAVIGMAIILMSFYIVEFFLTSADKAL